MRLPSAKSLPTIGAILAFTCLVAGLIHSVHAAGWGEMPADYRSDPLTGTTRVSGASLVLIRVILWLTFGMGTCVAWLATGLALYATCLFIHRRCTGGNAGKHAFVFRSLVAAFLTALLVVPSAGSLLHRKLTTELTASDQLDRRYPSWMLNGTFSLARQQQLIERSGLDDKSKDEITSYPDRIGYAMVMERFRLMTSAPVLLTILLTLLIAVPASAAARALAQRWWCQLVAALASGVIVPALLLVSIEPIIAIPSVGQGFRAYTNRLLELLGYSYFNTAIYLTGVATALVYISLVLGSHAMQMRAHDRPSA